MADEKIVTKKAPVKPAAPGKAVGKKIVARKAAPKKSTTKKAAPAAAKKVVPKKAAPATAKKVVSKKAAAPAKKTAAVKQVKRDTKTDDKQAALALSPRAEAATGQRASGAEPHPVPPQPAPPSPPDTPVKPQSPASPPPVPPEERLAMIQEAAYYKAEKRGFDPRFDEQNWTEAVAEVDAALARRRS